MADLNINHPQALLMLGFLGPVSSGLRFSQTVRKWPEDVIRWSGQNRLLDGDVVHFRACNHRRHGRPVLVLSETGVNVTCEPGAALILAEVCGIDFEAERLP